MFYNIKVSLGGEQIIKMKKVLLTNLYLTKYTGSELHTLEITKLLLKRGYKVVIAVQLKAYPLMKEIELLGDNVEVIECQYEELPEKEYDLIIVQHYPVFDYLCCNYDITYKKLVISKLSVISDYELLPVCIEQADAVWCVSEECAEAVIKQGIDEKKVEVFYNSVSESFFSQSNYSVMKLKKIAVISNHIPSEIIQLKEQLNKEYQIDFIGVEYTPRYVDRKFLEEYDLIITIGRTVQQCFVAGIPVYIYDYFGGPGYINSDNFILAEKNNFSGRGFAKKTVAELKKDIVLNYITNMNNIENLKKMAKEKYSYDINFEKLYSKLENSEVIKQCNFYRSIDKKRINAYSKQMLNNLVEKSIESRIYIDEGNGFNEKDSVSWKIMENYDIEQKILVSEKMLKIRFDPADCPCQYKIIGLKINGKEKQKIQNLYKTVLDYDPQLVINIEPNENLENKNEIVIKYNVKRIGEYETINCLNQQLSEKNNIISGQQQALEIITNSTSWRITEPLRKLKDRRCKSE